MNVQIDIFIENYMNIQLVFTLLNTPKRMFEFVQTNLTQRNVRRYSYKELIQTNVRMKICEQYLPIFEYMRFLNSKLNLQDKH